jgi:hypothetical protein
VFLKRSSQVYKAQLHQAAGYNDFGKIRVHVAHSYRQEVLRVRAILQQNDIDPGAWLDPFPDT